MTRAAEPAARRAELARRLAAYQRWRAAMEAKERELLGALRDTRERLAAGHARAYALSAELSRLWADALAGGRESHAGASGRPGG